MSCRASQVDQAPFGQDDDRMFLDVSLGLEVPFMDLGFELGFGDESFFEPFFETGHVDFVVEVPDVADDGVVGHP